MLGQDGKGFTIVDAATLPSGVVGSTWAGRRGRCAARRPNWTLTRHGSGGSIATRTGC